MTDTTSADPGARGSRDLLEEEQLSAVATPTAPSEKSLDRSLVAGIAWTGGIKWLTQIFSWVSTITVARLLSPDDYGIMAMAAVYVNFVAVINEFGLTTAILKRRDLTEQQIAKIGGFGIFIGLGFTLISVLLATPIAHFYKNPAVAPVIMWMSINFTVTAFGVLPRALMARDLQFRRLAFIDGISSISQIAITITLAFLGARYFSLVFSSVISSFIGAGLALARYGHRIALPRPFRDIQSAVHIGWHILVGRVAWYTYQNADFAVVGRVLGTPMLGIYNIGWEIATLPVERVSALVGQVTPSIFSSVQDDQATIKRYYLGVVGGIALLTFPAAIGIAMTANLAVPVLLGEKWLPAVTPLQLLAAYAGIRSIDTVTPQVLAFRGFSRHTMWYSIIAAIAFPILFFLATRWGVAGVAGTWVVAYPFVMFPVYRLLFRTLDLSFWAYLRNLWPAASSTLVMALVLWAARAPIQRVFSARLGLVVEILVGGAAYAAVIFLLHRDRIDALLGLLKRSRA